MVLTQSSAGQLYMLSRPQCQRAFWLTMQRREVSQTNELARDANALQNLAKQEVDHSISHAELLAMIASHFAAIKQTQWEGQPRVLGGHEFEQVAHLPDRGPYSQAKSERQ